MRTIDDGDFDTLQFETPGSEGERNRRIADTTIEWVDHPEQYALVPPLRATHMLLVAAEYLEMDGAFEEAVALAERAAAHPSAEPGEAAPTLVGIHLARDDLDAVTALLADYRRRGAVTGELAAQIADVLEGRPHLSDEDDQVLALAERWASIAIRLIEQTGRASGSTCRRSVPATVPAVTEGWRWMGWTSSTSRGFARGSGQFECGGSATRRSELCGEAWCVGEGHERLRRRPIAVVSESEPGSSRSGGARVSRRQGCTRVTQSPSPVR